MIELWDDLDYMVEKMKYKPYDWEISGDFPAVKIDQYYKNLGEAVRVSRNQRQENHAKENS